MSFRPNRFALAGAALFAATAWLHGASGAPDADALLRAFLDAPNPRAAAHEAEAITAAGVPVDVVYAALKAGRRYDAKAPTGSLERREGGHPYRLEVPVSYDPSRKYPVRIQLHGGVMMREDAGGNGLGGRGGNGNRIAGSSQQIYIHPQAWKDAPWWSDTQLEGLAAILDKVKRTYNVDENHVVVSGVSDGGTGTYYVAMRDTTAYAAFLPLNGYIRVLNNPQLRAGDLFPNNLRDKPFFIVNGGRDPLYPAEAVAPFVAAMKRKGVDVEFMPQPEAGHDTRWWPEVKDDYEGFVTAHPRDPLPDRLTWETSSTARGNRAHWLVIDKLAPPTEPALDPDLNTVELPSYFDFGLRGKGTRVDQVEAGSGAAALGFRKGDVIVRVNGGAITTQEQFIEALNATGAGHPIAVTVSRGREQVQLSGTFDPREITPAPLKMFDRVPASGRVDLVKRGNLVTVATRGVAEFTLLLSPDRFDLSRPVVVVVNGRTLHEGVVTGSTATLLKWASRDNDRALLVTAEVHIRVG